MAFDNDRRVSVLPAVAGLGSQRCPRQRAWQQAFAGYVPVILFVVAWAVLRSVRTAYAPKVVR